MNTFWTAVGGWWVQASLSGGAVLLLGWVAMLTCRTPAIRQRIGAWAVRGAVLAAVLSALPSWFLLPRPSWMTSPTPVEVKPDPIGADTGSKHPTPAAIAPHRGDTDTGE